MLAYVFPMFCILCVGFPFPAQGTENALKISSQGPKIYFYDLFYLAKRKFMLERRSWMSYPLLLIFEFACQCCKNGIIHIFLCKFGSDGAAVDSMEWLWFRSENTELLVLHINGAVIDCTLD